MKHGRHFTFKSVVDETAITLVASSVTGTLVSTEHPYVSQGRWIQMLIPDDLADEMASAFLVFSDQPIELPKTFSWPDRRLFITIVTDKN